MKKGRRRDESSEEDESEEEEAAAAKKPRRKRTPPAKGLCKTCGFVGINGNMLKHLQQCPGRTPSSDSAAAAAAASDPVTRVVRMAVKGGGPFWLHVDMDTTTTLEELSEFLRGIWLECCMHSSMFFFGKVPFHDMVGMNDWDEDDPDRDPPYKGLRKTSTIAECDFAEGQIFHYLYDYGSSTVVELKVVALAENVPFPREMRGKVRLLARNFYPLFPCEECGHKGKFCNIEDGDFICSRCAKKEEIDTDDYPWVKVSNSPRMGVCGYTGGESDDWPPPEDEAVAAWKAKQREAKKKKH